MSKQVVARVVIDGDPEEESEIAERFQTLLREAITGGLTDRESVTFTVEIIASAGDRRPVPRLSEQQKVILRAIEDGADTDLVARDLEISTWTARDQIRKLTAIFGVRLPLLPRAARERGVEF